MAFLEPNSFRAVTQKKTAFTVDKSHNLHDTQYVLRRYLSWIEGLTTNQNVTGSNPVRRTSLISSGPSGPFFMARCSIYPLKLTRNLHYLIFLHPYSSSFILWTFNLSALLLVTCRLIRVAELFGRVMSVNPPCLSLIF